MQNTVLASITLALFLSVAGGAQADRVCVTTSSCKAEVSRQVAAQNRAAASGPRWQLSPRGCQTAAREQAANTKRCRSYDARPGGKTRDECAKCYRQAVFDTARWEQCHQNGWAPPVASAQYRSIAILGADVLASK